MADYFSQTVIQPDVPVAAMTVLERRILSEIFEYEDMGDDVYFFASAGPNDFLFLSVDEAKTLLAESKGVQSCTAELVEKELGECEAGATELEIDMSMFGYEAILQDIVRRSDTLDHFQVMMAWTCSKMRPDGFGGMAIFITADDIDTMSTTGFLEEALGRLQGEHLPG